MGAKRRPEKISRARNICATRVLYYNVMRTGNVPADRNIPAGSVLCYLPLNRMLIKTISSRLTLGLALLFCVSAGLSAAEPKASKPAARSAAQPAKAAPGKSAKSPAAENPAPAIVSPAQLPARPAEERAADADPAVRAAAAAELGARKGAGKAALLKNLLSDKDLRVRAVAAKGLAREKDASAYATLSEALDGTDDNARLHAIEGLGALGDSRAEKRLAALLASPSVDVRWKAAEALANFKGRDTVDALLAKAAEETEDEFVRGAAINSLLKIGDKRAAAGLKALRSANASVQKLAGRAADRLEAGR